MLRTKLYEKDITHFKEHRMKVSVQELMQLPLQLNPIRQAMKCFQQNISTGSNLLSSKIVMKSWPLNNNIS